MQVKLIDKKFIFERFKEWSKPVIDSNGDTKYGWKVIRPNLLTLGDKIDIGYGTLLNCASRIEIDDYVQIGPYCSILSVSTIPCKCMSGTIKIGQCVMIGAYSLIMPGVTIGDGAIIPAYSYVDKDVKAFTIFSRINSKVIYQ